MYGRTIKCLDTQRSSIDALFGQRCENSRLRYSVPKDYTLIQAFKFIISVIPVAAYLEIVTVVKHAPADFGAYNLAVEVMAATSQTPDAQEGMAAFLEKRPPRWAR